MTPQIRQLFADAKTKGAEAAQLLAGTPSAENRQKATALLAEATALEEQASGLLEAERITRSADDLEAQEQEETRRRAEAAAAARAAGQPDGAQGSRGTAQTTVGEGQDDGAGDEVREEVIGEKQIAEYGNFMKIFGDFLEERRSRESPLAKRKRMAFRYALVNGIGTLKPEFRKLVGTKEIRNDEASSEEFRAMGLSQQSSLGLLVPDELQRDIMLAQKAFGGFRGTRTDYMRTSTGRTIPYPTIDDTSNEGSYQGENVTLPDATDVVVEPHEAGAYLLSSGVMLVSIALAQDESFGLENLLVTLGSLRNERRYQRALTTGTGVSQPAGLMTTITAGNTAANAAEFVQADFYNLKHHPTNGVNPAYHALAEWMLSSDALLKLKLAQLGTGEGIWQPGLGTSAPPTIDGDRYAINFHMDTVATTNEPVVYGDFSWMKAREVVPSMFFVARERYVEKLQIGFIQATRNDGREINPGVPALKKMTMA